MFKRILKTIALAIALAAACSAQKIDLATQTKGTPPLSQLTSATANQCLRVNGGATAIIGGPCPATLASALHNFLTSYNAATGAFTQAQPAYGDLTGTPVLAASLANVLHKWLNSYDASTGLFTQTQPDYSDLTGRPTLPANTAAVSHQFVTAYNSSTGAFTQAQPAYSDLTGTPVLASSLANVLHKWLNSYDASTGLFTQTQPDYSDLTGRPTLPANTAAVSHQFVTAYNSSTGAFTQVQPDYSDLTGVPSTFAPAAHNLLSASHGDTSAASAVRGDGLFAIGASPTWQRLAHPSTTGGYFKWNGTDVIASSSAAAGTGSCTNQVVTAENADAAPTCSTITSGMTSGTFSATAHNLLSATHGDTTAASAVRGDGLFAIGATPTWQRLAHPSTTGGYFKWNGTDVIASSSAAAGTGSCTNQFVRAENADAAPTCATVARTDLAATAKSWAFCGTATASAVTVGPVNAGTCCNGGTCQQFMVKYIITGYSGGTPVGRLQMGPGTPSTSALTNSISISENVTAPTTSGASPIPGIPLAVTLSAIGRSGTCWIDGASGSLKVIDCLGNDGTPSVSTSPTLFRAASFFSDLSTNLPLQQFQLTVYDAISGATVSTRTFNTGTYLSIWGRNND